MRKHWVTCRCAGEIRNTSVHSLTNQSGTIHTTSCVLLTFNTEVKPAIRWKTSGPRRPGLSPDASLRGFTPRSSWSWRLSRVCCLTPNTLRCERPREVETSDADLWTRTEEASTTKFCSPTVSSSSSDRFLIQMCCCEIKTVNSQGKLFYIISHLPLSESGRVGSSGFVFFVFGKLVK